VLSTLFCEYFGETWVNTPLYARFSPGVVGSGFGESEQCGIQRRPDRGGGGGGCLRSLHGG
jgi:hypothetical protein